MSENNNKRLLSLDALRGFDMMFIMGVESLIIAICQLFPGSENSFLIKQMKHSDWAGLTHYDTIFPLFIFLAGLSFTFSFNKQKEQGKKTSSIVWKLVRRTLILIALGVVYNGFFQFDWEHLRCASVLGRIGLACLGASLIYMFVKSPVKRVIIAVGILLGYWLLIKFVPAPDVENADPYSMQGCLVGWVDRILMPGRLLYDGGRFDPEGLLSTLPAIVTAMLGTFTGDFIRIPSSKISGNRKTLYMLGAAVILGVLGYVWGLEFPVCKKMWSSSFVLAVGSYSVAIFAIFYWIIDVKGWQKWCFPFKVIGMNSITIYLLQKIVSIPSINRFFLGGVAGLCSEPVAKVVFATGYVLISWLILYFFYKKKVFLKV